MQASNWHHHTAARMRIPACHVGHLYHKEPNPRFEVGSLISNLESMNFTVFNLVQNSYDIVLNSAINLTDLKLNSISESMKERYIRGCTNWY